MPRPGQADSAESLRVFANVENPRSLRSEKSVCVRTVRCEWRAQDVVSGLGGFANGLGRTFRGKWVFALCEQGWELSRLETEALLAIEVGLWSEVATRIDPRLQRCSLKSGHDV